MGPGSTERSAVAAAEHVIGRRVESTSPLDGGRTSDAWLVIIDGGEWVVRVSRRDPTRPPTYDVEAELGTVLSDRGHPVARWSNVVVDGVPCSVARRLRGRPVGDDERWSTSFAGSLAAVLRDLHSIPVSGFGPVELATGAGGARLVGVATDARRGLCERWSRAPIWPFDATALDDHPVRHLLGPELVRRLRDDEAAIVAAAGAPFGPVHSDLHRAHVLVDDDGRLAGLLDFGDVFVGSTSWDLALLLWYFGPTNAASVATAYGPVGTDLARRAGMLAWAIGLHKLARNPTDGAALGRLDRLHGPD